MPDRAKIIEKVRLLYALADNNPSKEEADAARVKADELVAKHKISADELVPPNDDLIERLRRMAVPTRPPANVNELLAQVMGVAATGVAGYVVDESVRRGRPATWGGAGAAAVEELMKHFKIGLGNKKGGDK